MIIVWLVSFLMIFQLKIAFCGEVNLNPYHLLLNVFPEGDQTSLYQLLENGQKERKRKDDQESGPVAKKPKFQPDLLIKNQPNFIQQRCGKAYFESKKLEIEELLLKHNPSETVNLILQIAIDYIIQDVRPTQFKSPSNELIKITAKTVICRSFESISHDLSDIIDDYDDKFLKDLITIAVASKQKNKVK